MSDYGTLWEAHRLALEYIEELEAQLPPRQETEAETEASDEGGVSSEQR
jgi:hypothetical protein